MGHYIHTYIQVLRLCICVKTPCYRINCRKVMVFLDDEESFIWREEHAAILVVLTIKMKRENRATL